ncbi:MAG TPA: ABC transporter ATP-binding protein, partial [Microthrixaceae bacterium]|nr:ABC transporter ATP-binding protein [Microthrixaceae bacterium]
FMLVPVFTVAENLMLGNEPASSFGRLNLRSARRRIVELSSSYGLDVDPDVLVGGLALGGQQRVEILKALNRDADCLILDEPTAVLTPAEISELETTIRALADSGKSVIFISHKLSETMRIADRIVVLREGQVVGHTTPSETTEKTLAKMMVGRSIELSVETKPSMIKRTQTAIPRFSVAGLSVVDDRGQIVVDDLSFEIRAGEILAVAGIQGNGQSELVQSLTGLQNPVSGSVRLDGRDVTGASSRLLFDSGVGHIPEDRQRVGLIAELSVADNLVLNSFNNAPFARRGSRQRDAVRENARALSEQFEIRSPSVDAPVSTLSGGNQQKVIVAREFGHSEKLLIAAQPTRGLDVSSVQYIHGRIAAERDSGSAVLLVSSDLDEVLALADRIAVMVKGRFIGVVDRVSADREQIGLMMAGTSPEDLDV